ncbi:MAG: hypothetical protein PHW01_01760 [Patescibacteria group bacterium]|nr:hypothetical protein [Patescibacteria group bacterium]
MQIKTKNFWKILILLCLAGLGLFSRSGTAQAEMVPCDGANDPLTKGETACETNQNKACASSIYTSGITQVQENYCASVDNNLCIVGTDDCEKCNGYGNAGEKKFNFSLFSPSLLDINLIPAADKAKSYQFLFNSGKVGCKAPAFCAEIPSSVSSTQTAVVFTCATIANACGGGKGVYEKGGQILPQVCLDSKKPCTPKIERELPAFVVTIPINYTVGTAGYQINIGEKAYCASPRDTIDPASCFMERDVNSGRGENFYIGQIPEYQNNLDDFKNNIQPLYDCNAGSLVSQVAWKIFNNSIGLVVSVVFGIIALVVCGVLQGLLFLIFAFLEWVLNFSQIDFGIVDLVWRFLRDFSNMFFIVVLLYIAFCTVLGIQERSLKKMLPGFLAGVVLINFSKVLCGVAVDFSQILSDIFLNLNPNKIAPIKALFGAAGLGGLFGVDRLAGSTDFTTLASVLGAQILMILYMLSAVIVYGATALLLAVRIVVLLLMTAISPLIYLAMAVGQKKIVSGFWNTFLRTAFFAPVMIFCITLSVIVLSADLDAHFKSKAGTLESLLSEGEALRRLPAQGASPQVFMKLLFAVAFMMAGLYVARKASVMGASGILQGANKLWKTGSEWLTMGKPAAAGAKALGKYGWGKAMESRAGKYLKWVSPKVWKAVTEARRKRREKEIYGPRITELQPRLAGWHAFFQKKGPGYEREKLYARGAERAAVKEVASSLNESDVQTEALYTRLDELLKEMEGKGWLGSDQALTAEVQGLLEVILSRGDINDLLKGSEYARKFSGGKAVMGSDTAVLRRLFGDSDRASMFANDIAEAMKQTYPQFSYSTTFDEADNRSLNTAEDDEDLQKIELAEGENATGQVTFLEKTAVFQKYLRKKAEKLKVEGVDTSFEKLSNLMLDNFGYSKEEILKRKDKKGNFLIADEKLREGVATVVDTYNQNRTRIISSEQAKRSTYQKRWHPGLLFRDMSISDMSKEDQIKYANAPPGAKYLGLTPGSRGQVEPLTDEDVDRLGSWAQPRLIESLRYIENQKDLLGITDEMEKEAERLEKKGKEGAAKVRRDKAQDMRRILKKLFDKVGQTGGEGGSIAGAGDRRGRDRDAVGESSRAETLRQDEDRLNMGGGI